MPTKNSMTIEAPFKGIVCMVIGVGLLTLNDAVMKWLTADYPIGQIMFVRGALMIIPIVILAWASGGISSLRVRSLFGQGVRAAFFVASTFLFLFALSVMPLASVVAIGFTGPLFLTALAAPVLGERVGWRRWIAVFVGFAGVIVMVRPTAESLAFVALLPLGASLADAAKDLATRKLAATDSSIGTLWFTNIAITLSALPTAPFGWQPLRLVDLGLLVVAALVLVAANYFLIETFRFADASLVSPFKYTAMVWAILFGFFVWGDVPNSWLILGACLVIGSGFYILRRENRG